MVSYNSVALRELFLTVIGKPLAKPIVHFDCRRWRMEFFTVVGKPLAKPTFPFDCRNRRIGFLRFLGDSKPILHFDQILRLPGNPLAKKKLAHFGNCIGNASISSLASCSVPPVQQTLALLVS